MTFAVDQKDEVNSLDKVFVVRENKDKPKQLIVCSELIKWDL